ncbi:Recombination protein recR [Spirochaeta thermophila DSM 6578]|uniref:Recombination protein RecR n=1 Tax=Winmispira thermophila (strain ATCC 700085 / DSM 6578 / Z-1203) TaxID=869211 RepID=G0GG57_WINT7|nr:recombination mediator RecR [Spirochaeta thermophila]AEJ62533.1 Recombination protein recR [Spirochaeta thermophila DSM 6578]
MNSLEVLIGHLSRLPGVGKKSASRIAHWLLKADRAFVQALGRLIMELPDRVKRCSRCGMYSDATLCEICSDPARDHRTICVVEQPSDVWAIEATHTYRGLYHVLHGAIAPLEGVRPEDLTIDALVRRLEREPVEEVIIATNPTVEGDTTALYLVRLLKDWGGKVSRLALGLPVGGDLEYADRVTLARALEGRQRISSGEGDG